jgi:hypothetical protein
LDWGGEVLGVGTETAPGPVCRGGSEASTDWVLVDVVELLGSLVFCEDVEVVVAGFPDVLLRTGSGETLLDDLHGGREWDQSGLAEEHVDVVGHDDIAGHGEVVLGAGLLQGFEEGVAGLRVAEDGELAITAEGQEAECTGMVMAD